MNNNNNIQERKVTITFPLFPYDYLAVLNELTCIEANFSVSCEKNVTIETHINEETIAYLRKNFQVNIDVQPLAKELKPIVLDILRQQEEHTLELNYCLDYTFDGSDGDYIESCGSVWLDEDDDTTIIIGFEWHDAYDFDLSEDFLVKLFSDIIEQSQQ